ncbi:MAG: hypothetical protein CVV57_01505 [Tenericutes bacterium HGW-Tenericutes-2]|jgi:uncharacterized protein YegL|nr:MAG: hypothetical protein CVV57_01505 [Tenericutes bacterium HGW-Tenericutes-2]
MSGLESDMIGGFNSMIAKQKKVEGEAVVSTVLFDDQFEVLHNRVPLELVRPMTGKDYYVRGSTALLDAIGRGIKKIGNVQKYTPEDFRAEKVIFIITTDGMENASREYSYESIKKMVERQKEMYNWEFIFLGANIDALETAERFGTRRDRAANFHSDGRGTRVIYDVLGETINHFRINNEINSNWMIAIDEDYMKRQK